MKKKYIPAIGAALLAVGLLLYLAGVEPQNGFKEKAPSSVSAQRAPSGGHEGHGGTAPAPAAAPESKSAEGKASVEAPAVEITMEKQQMIGVKTVSATLRPLRKILKTVGRIEYDERRLRTVNTKVEGWIEKLYIDYTGRYVRQGEPMAELYSPELLATQEEYLNIVKWRQESGTASGTGAMLSRDAEALVEAAKKRLQRYDISEAQIRELEQTGKARRTLTIYSPANGYVVQKMVIQGMRVMPGEKLFDVADLSTVWVIADVYEYELSSIRVGEPASISLSYLPGKEFQSKIDYVYPMLSGETRTARVRFAIPNPEGRLKPQMYASVEIEISLGSKLAIPDDAVIETGTRQIVYVDKGEGYFEPREVMLGLRAEGYREVLTGLKAGEKVAASATFLIDSESQLKGVKPLEGAVHKH
ncbi:MAG: Cation efflux system protein CusB precursor [Syntrophaceae bacterium PtaU1.Bin231]|nr:MAG: Cation efflux system protein CusB precursor [Syntrophaceae bacterium PtaB.Bin038]OPY87496.1 MAG: Cation efflux system protein CusB precursor [Syntrophaceae bacterium PtaU1.Bin231]